MQLLGMLFEIVWWITPFVFIFSFMGAIKEHNNNGNKDIAYAVVSAISLLILCAGIRFS